MDDLNGLANAMSDRFFKQRDQELMLKLKAKIEAEEQRSALAQHANIDDQQTLDHLIEKGIKADTIAAVSLIPLIAIAWADREMEESEREAILKAASDSGISGGTPSYELIEAWLSHRPEDDLFTSWVEYVQAMKKRLEPSAMSQLEASVISRAEEVAGAAGGYLGLGHKISETEKNKLDQVRAAFA